MSEEERANIAAGGAVVGGQNAGLKVVQFTPCQTMAVVNDRV